MRHVIPQIVLLSAALSAIACSGDSKSETETHFLACKTDEDCRKHGAAFSCVERLCRERADAGEGSGGSSAGGASASGGTASASGGAQAGGAGGLASGGARAGTGGGGGGGSGPCGDPGEPCCDPFPGDGPNYCNGEYRCNGNTCVDCDCALGAYVPVCGTDGQTYDTACGRVCVPVGIACEGQCPCVAPATCPVQPPSQGTPCSGDESCFYERCSTYGRLRAQCSANTWTVETGACAPLACGFSDQCAAGQACVIKQGGALIADCMPNSCDGLVKCDCVEGCLQGCAVDGNIGTGVTVTCNTCPQGGCP